MTDSMKEKLAQELENGSLAEMKMEDTFTFTCKDSCMGRCCNTITILLDPWDVENMARHLDRSGRDFLSQFCVTDFSEDIRWPFVYLKHAAVGPCIFLLEGGKCRVYPARSRNCRTYPLGRAVKFEPSDTGYRAVDHIFMVEKKGFCHGHSSDRQWTVKEWLEDADALKLYELSDIYLALIHYATTELDSKKWMNENIAKMMEPLLYGPDMFRAKLGLTESAVSHEEFYRRRMKALQVLLTDLAAGFGFGPLAEAARAGSLEESFGGSLMERIKKILLTGEA